MLYRFIIVLLFISATHFSCTSNAKLSSIQLEQEQKIRHFVESRSFVFNATQAIPIRVDILNIIPNGNQLRNLSVGYSLSVLNDSISANLPYFGRTYIAPNPASTDNGIKVNTKDFDYSFTQNKKGIYIVEIKLNNDRNTSFFQLQITTNGYGTLQVQSANRESISFYGTIEPLKGDIR